MRLSRTSNLERCPAWWDTTVRARDRVEFTVLARKDRKEAARAPGPGGSMRRSMLGLRAMR